MPWIRRSATQRLPPTASSSQAPPPDATPSILFAGFSADSSLIALGTASGVRVYNASPLREAAAVGGGAALMGRGGVAVVEPLERTNILIMVGGGAAPRWPPNIAVVWDDAAQAAVAEIALDGAVLAAHLRRDRLVLVTADEVVEFAVPSLERRSATKTPRGNPEGLCALSTAGPAVTCFPGIQEGTITVRTAADEEDAFDTDDAFWKVHNNALRCIALNADGSLLATASTEGTLIRVWDTRTRNDVPVAELRRGADHSEIFSIAFSHDSSQLCVASDKGSVHVFALPIEGFSEGNTRSAFKDLGLDAVMPRLIASYVQSEWGSHKFTLEGESANARFIASFGPPHSEELVVVTMLGECYKVSLAEKSTDCKATQYELIGT